MNDTAAMSSGYEVTGLPHGRRSRLASKRDELAGSVADLPAVDSGVVHFAQIDANRHVNVIQYLQILTDATIIRLSDYGLDPDYPLRRGKGIFSVDHHARYLRELRLGDEYSVHVHLISATDKAVHTMACLVRSATGQTSCTLESLLVNVDLDTRHVVRFDDDIQQLLSAALTESVELDLSGSCCELIRIPGISLV